ncbi:MAG: DUF3450 family protein [Opitutales bacterium]
MMKASCITFLYLFFAATLSGAASERASPEAARQTLAEWVQTQQVLSEEKTRWREEQQVLTQSIALLEKESDLLTARLSDLDAAGNETARERNELGEENEALLSASAEAEAFVAGLENEIRALQFLFPPPLQEQTAPLFSRLERAKRGSGELGQRLQSVLGILGAVNRFQQNVTLSREVRKLDDGSRREVQTMYMGLAQAYFVDESGRVAGTGRPAGSGWEWHRDDSIAAAVNRAVAILRNERAASFVNLPVEVPR